MEKRNKLSKAERSEISILLKRGYSRRAIAEALERSPNTVSYEVRENSVRGVYNPRKAHAKARVKRRYRRLQWRKIDQHRELRVFIIEKLRAHWNPDEVAGYLRRHRSRYPFYASKTAIYEWLRTARGEQYCRYLYTERKRVKRRKPKVARVVIPERVSIHERSPGADNRTRYGHHEADTIVGKKGTRGGLKVVYERKARLVRARKVESMRPREHARVLSGMLSGTDARSVTYDNGIENRDHGLVGVPSFFTDPYSSWQKGGVEHANKMLRRYFPKGTDFSEVTQGQVAAAVAYINGKPRRVLGYRTALEVAWAAGIIKSTGVLIGG